MYQRVHVGVYM